MDVRLPNGRIIKNVPEGTPKDEIKRKAVAAGLISDSEFPQAAAPTPVREEGFRFYQNQAQPAPEESQAPQGARASVPSDQGVEPYQELTATQEVVAHGKRIGRTAVETGSAISDEVKRSALGGFAVPVAQTLLSLHNTIRDTIGIGPSEQEKGTQQLAMLAGLSLIGEKEAIHVDSRGKVQYDRPETVAGTLAPYLFAVPAGFTWVAGSSVLKGLNAAAKISVASIASDVGVNQLITDPFTDNLIDTLEDAFPDVESIRPITAYLATEEEDPEMIRRLKMAGQDTLISGVFAGTASVISMFRKVGTPEAKKAIESGVKALTPTERGELFYQVLHTAKEGAKAVVRPVLRNGKPVYRDGRPVFEQVKDEGGNLLWRSYAKPSATATAATPNPTNWQASPANTGTFNGSAAPTTPTPGGGTGNVPPTGGTTGAAAAGGVTPPTPGAPTTPAPRSPLPDAELRQIEQQADSWLTRMRLQTFTSRGYWTETLFGMSQKSQAEQRAILSQGDHVAKRLTVAMDRAAREIAANTGVGAQGASGQLIELTHKALTSGNAADLNALPDSVREEVITARGMIDGLTQRMIDSPAVYDEFKKTLIDGQGTYLRRSYEAFTNSSYVPSATNRSEAVDFLTQENVAAGMPLDEAAKIAEGRVVALLGRDGRGLDSYVSDAVKVNNSVYSKIKDVPEPIRKLLGEITNPSDNIIQSVRKLTGFVQADQFSRDLLEVGDGKFLFDKPQGIYTVPITGTNTVLDVVEQGTATMMPAQAAGRGRYTTPEIARAIAGKQVEFISPSATDPLSQVARAFIAWKGTSQSAKTIYSHTTHFKNFLGASMMRAANGSNPFGSATKAWSAVSNEIGRGVDAAAQEVYEKYLRLGIINTNVNLGDISEMMKTALDNPNGFGDYFVKKADEFNATLGKVAGSAIDGPRAVYMGTDDFFKIGEFEDYLDVLKRAYPNESIDVLEARAAGVVRNVLPNYDLVPNAIKQLRTLPLGNFVGFPSEVVRTSTNIIRLGFDEMSSGNPVLYERGMRRLAAFGMFGGMGTEALSNTTKTLAGFSSEEEQRALDIVSRTPWSQDPTVFVVRDAETGELYKADTNSLDPYDYFRAPVKAAMRQISEGTMSNQELDALIMEASGAYLSAQLKPFLGEALVTEALVNAWTGWTSEDGKARDGTEVNVPGMSARESAEATLEMFWATVEPGMMTSLRKFEDAATERYAQYTGEPMDPRLAAINQLGLTWTPLKLDTHIEFVAGDYIKAVRGSDTIDANYRTTPEDIIQKYEDINRDRYEAQRILYEQVSAANTLGLSTYEIRGILKEKGLNEEEVWDVTIGQYSPAPLSDLVFDRIRDQVYAPGNTHTMTKAQLENRLRELRASFENNSLLMFEDETEWRQPDPEGEAVLKEGPLSRLLKAVGGVVQVPNAPMFPAARVDKFTGLPYDLQAGGSYIEDNPMARLLKACGGPVRQQKAGGGVVSTGRTSAACGKILGRVK